MNETNRVVVKTGKAKHTYHSPFNVSQMIGVGVMPVLERQILDGISNMDAALRSGSECICVLENGILTWCNEEGSPLPMDLIDDDFTDLEVNDQAYDMWKKSRVKQITASLDDSDLDILKEHFAQ